MCSTSVSIRVMGHFWIPLFFHVLYQRVQEITESEFLLSVKSAGL